MNDEAEKAFEQYGAMFPDDELLCVAAVIECMDRLAPLMKKAVARKSPMTNLEVAAILGEGFAEEIHDS